MDIFPFEGQVGGQQRVGRLHAIVLFVPIERPEHVDACGQGECVQPFATHAVTGLNECVGRVLRRIGNEMAGVVAHAVVEVDKPRIGEAV